MDIKRLEKKIHDFIYDLETEDRLNRVGLKEKSELAKVFKKYKKLFTKQNLESLKEESSRQARTIKYSSSDPAKPESREVQPDIPNRLYYTLAGSYIGLTTAADEDKIKTYFAKAKAAADGKTVSYFQLAPMLAKEEDFHKRELLDNAATPIVFKVNPKQLALLRKEIEIIKGLGYKSYIDYFSKAKKMDYDKFYKVAGQIRKETDKRWEKVINKVAEEVLGHPYGNLRACHLVYLRSISMFDKYYPRAKVVPVFRKFARDLGCADLLPKIKIDDVDRPAKNPRAVCYWPDPPGEIHLVIKPIGGEQDFEAALHEGGHALHGASVDRNLPYSLKALSYSNALTETYAFVLEDLVFDSDWLSHYLSTPPDVAKKIYWQATFVNLMMLRRYLGKFSYEYQLFSLPPVIPAQAGIKHKKILDQVMTVSHIESVENDSFVNGPKLYAKNLYNTTGFITKEANWLSDMDSGFYSADYLRAWIGAAQIKDYLVKKFGRKWFLDKRAGKFLRDLWSRGVQDEIEDVVGRLGYKPLDVSYLVDGYKRL